MRLLLILFAFGVQSHQPRVDRIPYSYQGADGCDSEQTARQIDAGKKSLPHHLFHFGKKEVLMIDVEAGTVPEQAWNDYIMGTKTRYHLKRFRRGLYGTERVESADAYGNSKYNWLIKIDLKESCLVPERAVTLYRLPENIRFVNWYQSNERSWTLKSWEKNCYENDMPRYNRFTYYHPEKKRNEDPRFFENECEKVIGDYLEEMNVALVQDQVGDMTLSWALRDRNCIQDIHGSPKFWAKEFSQDSSLWENHCKQNAYRNHRNIVRVWFDAMADAGYQLVVLENFSKMITEVKPPKDKVDWQTEETDRFAAQDFARTLESVGYRCWKKGRAQNFQQVLRGVAEHVDHQMSEEVKFTLESACR